VLNRAELAEHWGTGKCLWTHNLRFARSEGPPGHEEVVTDAADVPMESC